MSYDASWAVSARAVTQHQLSARPSLAGGRLSRLLRSGRRCLRGRGDGRRGSGLDRGRGFRGGLGGGRWRRDGRGRSVWLGRGRLRHGIALGLDWAAVGHALGHEVRQELGRAPQALDGVGCGARRVAGIEARVGGGGERILGRGGGRGRGKGASRVSPGWPGARARSARALAPRTHRARRSSAPCPPRRGPGRPPTRGSRGRAPVEKRARVGTRQGRRMQRDSRARARAARDRARGRGRRGGAGAAPLCAPRGSQDAALCGAARSGGARR